METKTIRPDAPGHPDTRFKIFVNGIKVATITKEQAQGLLHNNTSTLTPTQLRACQFLSYKDIQDALDYDRNEWRIEYQGH